MPQNEPQSGERWRGADGTVFRIFLPPSPNPNGYGVFEVRSEPPSPHRLSYLEAQTLMRECWFVDDAPIEIGTGQSTAALDSVASYEEGLMGQLRAIMFRVEPLRIFRRLLEYPGLIVNCSANAGRELQLLGERYNVVLADRVGATLFEGLGIGPEVEYVRLPGYTTPTDMELRIWNASPGMGPVDPENRPRANQVIGDNDFTMQVQVQPNGPLQYVYMQTHIDAPNSERADQIRRLFEQIETPRDNTSEIRLDRLNLQVPDEPHQLRQQPEPGPDIGAFQQQMLHPGQTVADVIFDSAHTVAAQVMLDAQHQEDAIILQTVEREVLARQLPARAFLDRMRQEPLRATVFQSIFGVPPENLVSHLGFPTNVLWEEFIGLTERVISQLPQSQIRPGPSIHYYINILRSMLGIHGIDTNPLPDDPIEEQIEAVYRAQPPLNQELINQMLTTLRHPTPEIQAFIGEVLDDGEMRRRFQAAFGQHPIDFFAPLEIENPNLLIADIRTRMEAVDDRATQMPFTVHSIEGFQRLAAGLPVTLGPADEGARPAFPQRHGPFTMALQGSLGVIEPWTPPKPPENPTFWERLNREDDDASR